MKAGGAYVPVDPTGPAERARRILADCHVSAVFVHDTLLDAVPAEEPLRAVIGVGGGTSERRAGDHRVIPLEDALAAPPGDAPGARA